ncbi:MAG: efflux RND transporter periplasmic adaptor subunit [Rhodopirellula sp. JB044]|uniref:efflux RND transporter periplasmic adaptor subunit n=1 Tax=Rhodopirellula sp. JB044 TaxID=3342844 RepID=UPI00370C11BE
MKKCLSLNLAVCVLSWAMMCHAAVDAANPSGMTHSSYEGFAEAILDVELSTDEFGQLVDVPVQIGEKVRKGQLLAQLDDGIQRAAAEVAKMQAAMTGEVRSAEAARELQVYRVEQLKSLHQDQMAGGEELRRAKMELDVADARLQIAMEQNRLRKTELRRLELQVEQRQIHAPFDGIVAAKRLDAGDALTPGNATILRLIRTDVLIGVFNVPAESSFAMRPGMAVQVFFRAARQTVDAEIESIAPAIDGESGTVRIRVRIPNPDEQLRPGDRLSMRITPGQDLPNVVPGQAAIQRRMQR